MSNSHLIISGKLLSHMARTLNLGNGSTWPGHIALKGNKHFIRDVLKKSHMKVIIVAGTNGKTTTSALITHILKTGGKKVLQNQSGANLLNGIASTLLLSATIKGVLKHDFAIFEVDENALPLVLQQITPDYLILLNLFRDQLDRYGEVNTIARKWKNILEKLDKQTTVILNADDPQIAYLGNDLQTNVHYFSVKPTENKIKKEEAVDSLYCPRCGNKLTFQSTTFSHLGNWVCPSCTLQRPKINLQTSPLYPLPGIYNQYNTNAAVLVTKHIGISESSISKALQTFHPAFGRQEEILINGKHVRIFLSKNPTGFNESLRTSKELGAKHILFVLNDRIPDGRDVSWIWDTDIEGILDFNEYIIISGDRTYDMALRIKYAIPSKFQISNFKFQIEEQLHSAIKKGLQSLNNNETLYIIPTYSAMLETRKILTGKKIL